MFREMRRKKQSLPAKACMEILQKGSSGVLAVSGDDGYPYAVPLSYVYHDGKLYFHCARSGHKLDAIKTCSKASFCVIDQDQVVPLEYTTYYKSVIVFGQIRIMADNQEIRTAIDRLAEKYAPEDAIAHRQAYIDKDMALLCMLEMDIHHMTGKQAKEII